MENKIYIKQEDIQKLQAEVFVKGIIVAICNFAMWMLLMKISDLMIDLICVGEDSSLYGYGVLIATIIAVVAPIVFFKSLKEEGVKNILKTKSFTIKIEK